MPLFVVKIIDFVVEPLGFGLLLVILGLGVSTRYQRVGQGLVGSGVFVLWITATPWMGTALIDSLENEFPPRPIDEVPPAEAIVVLGGGIGPTIAPRLYPDLNDAGDRLWHGARLYRADKAPRVIVSGGRVPGRPTRAAPAMKTVLTDWQVPADSVIVEAQSSSTHGNARYTATICRRRGIDRVLLVTSAAHMWRAAATFRSAAPSLTVTPAPTDYRAVREPFTPMSVLPDADGLSLSTAAAHEYVGFLYYKMQGWID